MRNSTQIVIKVSAEQSSICENEKLEMKKKQNNEGSKIIKEIKHREESNEM